MVSMFKDIVLGYLRQDIDFEDKYTLIEEMQKVFSNIELYKEKITPHIQVHDELDISVSNNADRIKDIMEHAVSLEVPNKVDYESGPNWGIIK